MIIVVVTYSYRFRNPKNDLSFAPPTYIVVSRNELQNSYPFQGFHSQPKKIDFAKDIHIGLSINTFVHFQVLATLVRVAPLAYLGSLASPN